mgnify:CR=1 FL=1
MQKKRDSSFYIANEKLDIVQNYTCLGICTSPSGNLTLSLDHLRQKTLMLSLRRHTDLKSVKSSLACSSEVWRTFVRSDFKSWDNSSIEKAHLQFFQKLINNSTTYHVHQNRSRARVSNPGKTLTN